MPPRRTRQNVQQQGLEKQLDDCQQDLLYTQDLLREAQNRLAKRDPAFVENEWVGSEGFEVKQHSAANAAILPPRAVAVERARLYRLAAHCERVLVRLQRQRAALRRQLATALRTSQFRRRQLAEARRNVATWSQRYAQLERECRGMTKSRAIVIED
jgi:hypothetical protein